MRIKTRQYMIGTATELLQGKDSELATVAAGSGKDWEWVIGWDDTYCEGICLDCDEWSEFITLAVNITYLPDETYGDEGAVICLQCKGEDNYKADEWEVRDHYRELRYS